MKNIIQKLLLILVITSCIVLAVNLNQTPPINWSETYHREDKIPYGSFILDQELQGIMQNDSIIRTSDNLYSFLTSGIIDTLNPSNLVMIGPLDYIDKPTTKRLFQYIEKGNTVMLLMPYIDHALTDTLMIQIKYNYSTTDQNSYQLTNKNLSNQVFSYDYFDAYHFDIPDTARSKITVLGNKISQGKSQPNLILVPLKQGQLILGLNPIAFTNYFLLQSNNHLYAQSVLSYLPNQTTYFFIKPDKLSSQNQHNSDSIMRFVFANPALKWAWRLFLLTFFLFALFTAKRKQKIIPIISPLRNNSVDFVKTISNLYIQNKDYTDIMQKSIFYTLEKIRTKYYIQTQELNQDFVEQLAKKSLKNIQDIQNFTNFVNQFYQNKQTGNKELLLELNKLTQQIID
ncbi:hypothetical protein [Myroides sp. LJL119]